MAIVPIQQDTVGDPHVVANSYDVANHKLRRVADRAIVADGEFLGCTAARCDPNLCPGESDTLAQSNGQVANDFWHVLVKQQGLPRAHALQAQEGLMVQLAH
jgi:hypothetical protein